MKTLFLVCSLLSTSGYAQACLDCSPFYWGISGSFGAGTYQNAYGHDGSSFVGRLSLEAQYAMNDVFHFGMESGIQNGNTMRLAIPKSTLDIFGGEPIHASIKPIVDLLATVKMTPFNSGFFGYLKGGVAYRHLQVDRNEVNDLRQITPELQTGIGFGFNDVSYLYVGYQGLFGNKVNYQVNESTAQGHIANIPTQNSILIGVSILF